MHSAKLYSCDHNLLFEGSLKDGRQEMERINDSVGWSWSEDFNPIAPTYLNRSIKEEDLKDVVRYEDFFDQDKTQLIIKLIMRPHVISLLKDMIDAVVAEPELIEYDINNLTLTDISLILEFLGDYLEGLSVSRVCLDTIKNAIVEKFREFSN